VDPDHRTVWNLTGEDFVGERVLEIFLHGALQRPCAIDRVVTDAPEPGARGIGEVEPDLAILEQLREPRDLDVDDRAHVAGTEAVEQDDLVEAVEKLGPEMRANHLHHLRLDLLYRLVL